MLIVTSKYIILADLSPELRRYLCDKSQNVLVLFRFHFLSQLPGLSQPEETSVFITVGVVPSSNTFLWVFISCITQFW